MPDIRLLDSPSGKTYRSKIGATARLLFLAANPKDEARLQTEKEYNAVYNRRLRYARNHSQVAFRPDIQREKLLEVLTDEQPTILHFSGHGQNDALVFTNSEGRSERVAGKALAELLAAFSDQLDCVVLNACYSQAQAEELAKHIPNVVGIDNAIQDDKAVAFADAFYLSLFNGDSYQQAFTKAIASVQVQDMGMGAQPVLYRWKDNAAAVLPTEHPKSKKALWALLLLPVVGLLLWMSGVFSGNGGGGTVVVQDTTRKDPVVTTTPNNVITATTITTTPTVTDPGRKTVTIPIKDRNIKIGNLTWHAMKLDPAALEGSWCYEDKASNCEQYGRLYSYDAAVKHCEKEGKRLPTEAEWKAALDAKGVKGMNLQYGGSRTNGAYKGMGEYGRYWTSTDSRQARMQIVEVKGDAYKITNAAQSDGLLCRCVGE